MQGTVLEADLGHLAPRLFVLRTQKLALFFLGLALALTLNIALRLLDAMRERALTIRRSTPATNIVREEPAKYRPTKSE